MENEIPTSSTDTPGVRQDMRSRSNQTAGLRDELSNLKSDLDALMLHASTLSESELREARVNLISCTPTFFNFMPDVSTPCSTCCSRYRSPRTATDLIPEHAAYRGAGQRPQTQTLLSGHLFYRLDRAASIDITGDGLRRDGRAAKITQTFASCNGQHQRDDPY